MLRVGDWVVIQGTQANGVVEDVTLSTVKVRNFDKTVVMVPPYTLVSTSFQNYRGMWESGVRRIFESLIVDLTTVVPCDPDRVAKVSKLHPGMADFIAESEKAPDKTLSAPGIRSISGSTLTNLGLFRVYMLRFLQQRSSVHSDMKLVVRPLEPTDSGLPVQLYFYTRFIYFVDYEQEISEVLDHMLCALPEFGLRVFQSPSGDDVRALEERLRAAPAVRASALEPPE